MATNFPDTTINNPNTSAPWANGDEYVGEFKNGFRGFITFDKNYLHIYRTIVKLVICLHFS